MKLPALIRRDPAAGLARAEQALAAASTRVEELENDRLTALAETDELTAVQKIDTALAEQRTAAGVLSDRVAVLKAALYQQERERLEQARATAIAEVTQWLDVEIGYARETEQAVSRLGDCWSRQLGRRGRLVSLWKPVLGPLSADTFSDIRAERRELATALFAAGKPSWDRQCSIPNPVAPLAVEGLSPKGISGYVAAAGAGFLARIKSIRTAPNNDEEPVA